MKYKGRSPSTVRAPGAAGSRVLGAVSAGSAILTGLAVYMGTGDERAAATATLEQVSPLGPPKERVVIEYEQIARFNRP